MAFKKYLTADNVHAQLDGNVNTTQTQIVFKNGSNVPTAGNWIATLVQYGQDGFPSKWEKVLVTSVAGQILTVQRAYDGSTAQTFNDNDYVFLNVVSEIIKDIQDRIDELGTDIQDRIDELGTSLGNYQLTSQKNQANGYAGLGADGKIDVGQIPAIKSHEFLTVTNAAARYALTTSQVQLGDEVLETSTGETYVLIASDPSQAGSWLFKSDTTPTWSSIAAKPTTIAGFGITDAYTKTEVDTALGNYYTKTQIDTTFGSYYTKTAADARFVHLTGNETIDGLKSFSSGQIKVLQDASLNSTIFHANGQQNWYVGLRGDQSNVYSVANDGGERFSVSPLGVITMRNSFYVLTETQGDTELGLTKADSNAWWSKNRFVFQRYRGTLGAKQATVSGDVIGAMGWRGYDGTNTKDFFSIEVRDNGARGRVLMSGGDIEIDHGGSGYALTTSGKINASGGLVVGNHSNAIAGITRWTGTKLQVYTGSAWVDLH